MMRLNIMLTPSLYFTNLKQYFNVGVFDTCEIVYFHVFVCVSVLCISMSSCLFNWDEEEIVLRFAKALLEYTV